jgi:hypothetical protein
MTTNQINALIKNPNTKKAIAVLTKFAKLEAEYKALEKESKSASALIKESMIENDITKFEFDPATGITGFITLAERTNYSAKDLEQVSDEFKKSALDADKVKAQRVLTGELPAGVEESKTQYIIKKFKVVE